MTRTAVTAAFLTVVLLGLRALTKLLDRAANLR